MKKKTLIISLVLSFTLIFSSFATVFAATGPATEATKKAIAESGVQCIQKIKNEVDAEAIAKKLHEEVADGGYQLIDTKELAEAIKNNKDMVIIDTMPEKWWAQRHVPGAICQIVGAMDGENRFPIKAEEKAPLLKKTKDAVGKKTVTKWYNKKTKKWTTKKPAKKYRGKSKKVKVVNKDKMIVVYCGFVGCARSHEGAKFLVENGYKNVYRYAGGISAWVDGGNDIEGTDVAQ